MPRGRKSIVGFSLIELMIVITILSSLMFTGTYVYKMLMTRWDKELGEFNESFDIAKKIDLTSSLLKGIVPTVVLDEKKPVFFFIGKSDSLFGITSAGIFSNGSNEIFKISAIKNDSGLYDLIYQSVSEDRFVLTNAQQTINFDRSILLFDNLERVEFSYFGWQHLFDKNDDQIKHQQKWTGSYSGIQSQYMPLKLELSLTKNKHQLIFRANFDTEPEKWMSPYFDRDH